MRVKRINHHHYRHLSLDSFKAIHKRETLPDGNKVDLHVLADHQSPPMADVGDAAVVNALKEVKFVYCGGPGGPSQSSRRSDSIRWCVRPFVGRSVRG